MYNHYIHSPTQKQCNITYLTKKSIFAYLFWLDVDITSCISVMLLKWYSDSADRNKEGKFDKMSLHFWIIAKSQMFYAFLLLKL